MRLLVLFLAAALAGCASSRPPEDAPPPPTLAEVNGALQHKPAVVFFRGGTFVRGRAEVGPLETVVRVDGRGDSRREVYRTEDVERIEVDLGLSSRQGALAGILWGAAPGAGMHLYGRASEAACRERGGYNCGYNGGWYRIGGAVLATVGAAIGSWAGAVSTLPEHYAPVYAGPVTRYPDAALALLDARPHEEASPPRP